MNHHHSALSSGANVRTLCGQILHRFDFPVITGISLLKVKGVKDAVTRREKKKKKELTNVPEVRDNAWMSLAETFFGSSIGWPRVCLVIQLAVTKLK